MNLKSTNPAAKKKRSDSNPSIKRKESLLEQIMIFMGCRSKVDQSEPGTISQRQSIDRNNDVAVDATQTQNQNSFVQIDKGNQEMKSKQESQIRSVPTQGIDEIKSPPDPQKSINQIDEKRTILEPPEFQAERTKTDNQQAKTTTDNQQVTSAEQDIQNSVETLPKIYLSNQSNNTDNTEEIFNQELPIRSPLSQTRFNSNQSRFHSNQSNISSSSTQRSVNSVIEVSDKDWMSQQIADLFQGREVTPPSNEISITVTHKEGNNLSFNITKQGTNKHYEFHVTLLRNEQGPDNITFQFNKKYQKYDIKNFYDLQDENVLYLCAIRKHSH